MQFRDIGVKGALLVQKLLREINRFVLRASPTGSGGGDYFIERSIFFILGPLCLERYNKSLCKTRFVSTLTIRGGHASSLDAHLVILRQAEKREELMRTAVAFFFYLGKRFLLNSRVRSVNY